MSVQEVTYFRVVCGREGCSRDSGDVGFTAAFPTPEAALTDWLRQDGTVDPETGVTLCNWHRVEPEMSEQAAAGLLDFTVDELHLRGVR